MKKIRKILLISTFLFAILALVILFAQKKNRDEIAKNGIDPKILGIWQSSCLIDREKNWAEKYKFVFKADGTATYTRWSGQNGGNECQNLNMVYVSNFSYKIPEQGKIDLQDLDTADMLYDIYQIEHLSLFLGEGFRGQKANWPKNNGGTESTRIESLNQYIEYKKAN